MVFEQKTEERYTRASEIANRIKTISDIKDKDNKKEGKTF